MKGLKVLIIGASGFVGNRLALELCRDNTVWGVARFLDERMRHHLESRGVVCVSKDLGRDSFDDLPEDFDYVFNEIMMTGYSTYEQRQAEAFDVNAYLAGRLMARFRNVKGFVHTSTNAVYPPSPGKAGWKETDNVGPIETYPLSKLAGEVVTTFASTSWNIPTCILRLGHPYSGDGGAVYMLASRIASGDPIAVNRRRTRYYNPIHVSDYVQYSIKAVELCTVPPRVVNAGGIEAVSVVELVERLGKALGIEPVIVDKDAPRLPLTEPTWVTDTTMLTSLMGSPRVLLDQGIHEVAARIKKLQASGVKELLKEGKAPPLPDENSQ